MSWRHEIVKGVGTYLLFSVYASVVCGNGEELLIGKSNTACQDSIRVFECVDGCFLLLNAELCREIHETAKVRRGRGDRVKRVSYFVSSALRPDPPS